MGIQLRVNAEVVNIKGNTPRAEDKFVVDTNVWFKYLYDGSSYGRRHDYKNKLYVEYIENALQHRATLYCSVITLAELAHYVEKMEFKYARTQSENIKEYRHNEVHERARVVRKIKSKWDEITNLAKPLYAHIDEAAVNRSLEQLQEQAIDGYDIFILEAMLANNITQIITDDTDFATVGGITVFTANQIIIGAAQQQNSIGRR